MTVDIDEWSMNTGTVLNIQYRLYLVYYMYLVLPEVVPGIIYLVLLIIHPLKIIHLVVLQTLGD